MEGEKYEKVRRYLKWVLGVGNTPGYMIREELQREEVRSKTGRRAWGFEKKMKERRGKELARRCLEEMRERGKVGKEERGGKRKEENFLKIER